MDGSPAEAERGSALPTATRIATRPAGWLVALQAWLTCCALCGRALDPRRDRFAHADLCDPCRGWLPPLDRPGVDRVCVRCGRVGRLFVSAPSVSCPRCPQTPPLYDHIVSAVRYDWPVDRLIGDLKYRDRRRLATPLGAVLAAAVRDDPTRHGRPYPELLLPVPPHRSRWRQRGYDHARDLAGRCARELGLATRHDLLERTVDTGSQTSRSSAEREFAIHGAFTADARLVDRHVAIVDDVLTSGATVRELARELYDTGAASVEVWTLARTPLDDAVDGSNTSRRTARGRAGT